MVSASIAIETGPCATASFKWTWLFGVTSTQPDISTIALHFSQSPPFALYGYSLSRHIPLSIA